MGQDEDALALVRRADFCRAEQTRRRRVTHVPKLSQHGFQAEADVAGDVLEEDPLGEAFSDDAGDIGPQMPGVINPAALSCGAERLAGISGKHGVKGPSEGSGIEAPQIVPDRGRGKISGALGCDEHGARPVFPFDRGAAVIAGLGEHEAQIQASAACAEGQSVPGT